MSVPAPPPAGPARPSLLLALADRFRILGSAARAAAHGASRDGLSFALMGGLRFLPCQDYYDYEAPDVGEPYVRPGVRWAMCRAGLVVPAPFIDWAARARHEAFVASIPGFDPRPIRIVADPVTGEPVWEPVNDPPPEGGLIEKYQVLSSESWELLHRASADRAEEFVRQQARGWLRLRLQQGFADYLAWQKDRDAALDRLVEDFLADPHAGLDPWECWSLVLFHMMDGTSFVRHYAIPLAAVPAGERSAWPPGDPLAAVDWPWEESDWSERYGRPPDDPAAVIQDPCEASAAACEFLAWDLCGSGGDSESIPTPPTIGSEPVTKRPRKCVNARMLTILADNLDAREWSLQRWAGHLGCSPSTVAETTAWKQIMKYRDGEKQLRLECHRRRGQ